MANTASENQIQEFFYRAPEATSVQLVGDFTHWQSSPIQMQKRSDGVWRAEVALPPGKHHYRFLVDGVWCDDPECTIRVPNAFGGHDMVREVAAQPKPPTSSPKPASKPKGKGRAVARKG
jgi:1,4-alpha-glucan branching enzyme